MSRSLEERVQILEDLEEIKRLKAKYCYFADRCIGGDPKAPTEFMALFADDARGEWTGLGVFEGKQQLLGFASEGIRQVEQYAQHMVHSPLIELDGDSATGKWYFEAAVTLAPTGGAAWAAGWYDEKYARINGEWLFSEILAHIEYFTPYEEGWVKKRFFNR